MVRAASKANSLARVTELVGRYGKDFNIYPKAITKAADGVSFAGKIDKDIIKALKLGKFDDAAPFLYNINSIPSGLRYKLVLDVKDLPSYKVGLNEARGNKLKGLVKETSNSSDYNKLTDAKSSDAVTVADIEKNSNLKRVFDYIGGKKFITFTLGTLALTGVGTAYLLGEVKKHRNRMSGCFRYSVSENGSVVTCKVAECSCLDGAMISTENTKMCDNSIEIPEEMRKADNCKNVVGYGCVNCGVEDDKDTGTVEDEDSLNDAAPGDEVFYKCNLPSFMDALGDLIDEEVDGVVNAVKKGANELGSLYSTVIKVLKWVVVGVGIILVIILFGWGIIKMRNISKKNASEEIETFKKTEAR